MSEVPFAAFKTARLVIAQSAALRAVRRQVSLLDTVEQLAKDARLTESQEQLEDQWGGW